MSFHKALITVVIFVFAFTAAANAANYTVPGWYNDPMNGWNYNDNIQEVLNLIAGGFYTEPGPHTITCAANMAENVMLYGEGASPFETDITIDGSGFMLTGSIDCIANTTNVTVTNFFPITNGAFGVNCGVNTTVVGNEINYCGNGVECHGTNAVVDNNAIMWNNNGVLSDASDASTISANLIASNNAAGVYVDGASPSIVSNSAIDQNGIYGIQVTGSGAPTISNNTIDMNTQTGIHNSGTGYVAITGNTITNNMLYGIEFLDGTANISGTNSIGTNGASESEGGIMIYGPAIGNISGNTINGNMGSGVVFSDATNGGHTVDDNIINDNGYYGIYYCVTASSDGSAITDNTINGNGASGTPDSSDMGIFIDDGTPNCHDNTITGNVGEGVFVTDNYDANPDFGGGAQSSTGNNVIHGNDSGDDSYDFYNANSNNIFAESNDWGSATNGQMSGNYYNTTDIDPAIYDNWENGSLGFVRWSDPDPTGIKSASLGEIKATFSGVGSGSGASTPENNRCTLK